MEKPLHILFLPRWYPHRYDPMLGLFVRRHAEAAALHNQVSVVFAFPDNENEVKHLATEIFEEPQLFTVYVRYKKCSQNNPFAKAINLLRYFLALQSGMRSVREKKGTPDLLHVHILTRLALIACWIKITKGIPYLITEHWSRYLPTRNEFNGLLRKWLSRIVVKKAAMVTTVTQDLAHAMQQHGLRNSKYVVLPNVVDMDLFVPLAKEAVQRARIIHISCFEDRSKNISGILRVLQKFAELEPDTECLLVGEGIDEQQLQNYANSLGLFPPFLQFTGLLQGKALAETLAKNDFLLLFSNYENMPVVILEAFACGLPVVVTAVGGIPEMVNADNGLLVEAGNEEQLLSALLQMSASKHQYKAGIIRNAVYDQYSTKAVAALLNDWYRACWKV
jgi:glycosyltransferase involved in cell wall biosynthesis